MLIDSENLVSITEVNQNFSKVSKLVEERGSVIVMKNNAPKFVISKFDPDTVAGINTIGDGEVKSLSVSSKKMDEVSKRLMDRNNDAYRRLADL